MALLRRTIWVYGILGALWLLVAAWQAVEHVRVRRAAETALLNRAKDISDTLGLVMRSQRRFGGVVSKERLESALNELIHQGELHSVALLNAAGDVVVAAGAPLPMDPKDAVRSGPYWTRQSVTITNLIDLGSDVAPDQGGTNLTIVLPRPARFGPGETNRPPGPPPMPAPRPADSTNESERPRFGPFRGERGGPRGPRDGRPPLGRPFWMSEEEYQTALKKQGVHGFVLVMSTAPVGVIRDRDLWLRSIIILLAGISAAGSGLAWSNLAKSSELQFRLVRASELNARLKDMNLAAAGLAHETRNPLNIVRGLAQLISRDPAAAEEIRQKSRAIVDETDRVTAQLNEFIDFSKPREVRRSTVGLNAAVAEVVRALASDLEEKSIRLELAPNLPTIEADEQLLRQALFNLLINAVQALPPQGEIRVVAGLGLPGEVWLEIRDNGPGVPPENRAEIFKPYFTTQEKGTGLGLAVVHQIVLAHGWEIVCLANLPQGAVFRLNHLRTAA